MDNLAPWQLTLIITTSPTPSAPSTELFSSIFESFRIHCPILLKCDVVVVFDGFDRVVSDPRLKKGCVTAEQAENYSLYKENIKEFMIELYKTDKDTITWTESDGYAMQYGIGDYEKKFPYEDRNVVVYKALQPFGRFGTRLTFIEPNRRMGFGLAVHAAVCSAENYVWVHQHDWILTSPIPLNALLSVMRSSESNPTAPIKYVCLPAVRTLKYSESAEVVKFPALRKLTSELKGDYSPDEFPDTKVPLTPLFSWHDKPHIASAEHYKARVFPSRLAMMRGDFIEDKTGQRAKAQMKEGHVSNNPIPLLSLEQQS